MSDHEGLVGDQQCYIETLETERDALLRERERAGEWAAYAEQLTSFVDSPSGGGMKGDPIWEDMKKEAPVAILDRLKAQWQAEALDELRAGVFRNNAFAELTLKAQARKLRRRARGDES